MKKSFPCWVCRGRGSWTEPILDDGSGPRESCAYCEGEGLIEIGGKRHMEIAAERIAMEILKYRKDAKEEWTWDELLDLGTRALNLIDHN